MPADITHSGSRASSTTVREEERSPSRDLGNGGKPPHVPRRTGGGGDGDGEDWEQRPAGHRGPRERLGRARQGMFFFLAGDAFFILLVPAAIWLLSSHGGHVDASGQYVRTTWHALRLPPILWLTTALIICASVTVEMARRHMFRETDVMEEWLGLGQPAVVRTLPWLGATLLLGSAFLTGQWLAWMQITHQRSLLDATKSHRLFGVIAALHGSHVLVGIVLLIVAIVTVSRLPRVESRQILVDCTAWYWHALGLYWLCLFGMLLGTQ